MYDAKTAGRNGLRFFDPAMQTMITARAALETDLREDLKKELLCCTISLRLITKES
jgi:predicted signal transduction protein with EAL and GGDEF domain